jgi:hypothetical protein
VGLDRPGNRVGGVPVLDIRPQTGRRSAFRTRFYCPEDSTRADSRILLVGAGLSAWIIWQIGAGKRWARSSLCLRLPADVLWAATPAYNNICDYIFAMFDLGPQVVATHLPYSCPRGLWFEESLTARDDRQRKRAIGLRQEL